MLRILILLIVSISCANKQTTYHKYTKDKGGYEEKILEDNLRAVSFKANSNTPVEKAVQYAKFRAIEICQKEEKKLTHILDVFDKTQSKTVTRTSSTGYPAYYYGMSPFYSRYSGFGYGFGFSTMNTSSWNETVMYPDIEVVFECTDKVYEPEFAFREVSPEDMKFLVKDLRGGLQVEKIPTQENSNIKVGDIIIYGNGERVQQAYQFLKLFNEDNKHSISVEVMRNGLTKEGLKIKGTDATDKVLKAQNHFLQKSCEGKDLKDNHLCKSI